MASTNSNPEDAFSAPLFSSEDVAVKAVNKRYEGLVTVRTKAIKGKGAWYWAHFEPILLRNPETNLPKALKLKCILCDAVFSASNPSRTASEHLKR
ncbi:Methylenetetrahydrofolate--tRNA-(uracil-5-)- methyltransferase, partial [Actinidia chinensis var. chinensis]